MAFHADAASGVRLLRWWQPPAGTYSSRATGWYDLGSFEPDVEDAFAEQVGREYGEGRYLLLAVGGGWWRELVVAGTTTYREVAA